MGESTKIEWTDATWNPITGCSVISPGCTNCYAMKLAGGRLRNHPSRKGLTEPSKAGPVWNGKVRFNADWLDQPLRWRRPRRIFPVAHGDLFHEDVPVDWLDSLFAVMALSGHHLFQPLTKRSGRMLAYCGFSGIAQRIWDKADEIACKLNLGEGHPSSPYLLGGKAAAPWPLPNVWLGTSVEDQERLSRVDELRATPAAVRFLSLEPLLEDLGDLDLTDINWVIVGGESGPRARPMHPAWARSIRDQCTAAEVPLFFKQWGQWHPDALLYTDMQGRCPPPDMNIGKKRAGRLLDGEIWDQMPGGSD